MNTTITVTTGADTLAERGSVLRVGGVDYGRVTGAEVNTLTYRRLHGWRWVEALRYWYERRIKWPLADWWAA